MSIETVRRKTQEAIFDIGRGALHAMAPDDFELYACTFELINSRGVIEDIFHFPVMPTGISVGRQSLVNVKKAGQSYISQFNNSFASKSISLNGTFGKKFRLLISKGKGSKIHEEGDDGFFSNYDLKVKTGYGAVKLLERIIESSNELDEFGNPKILIFYNSTLNHNHMVEVMNFQLQQSMENNMMWNYSIEIKAVADANQLLFEGDIKGHLNQLLAVATLNKIANNIFDDISVGGLEKKIKGIF